MTNPTDTKQQYEGAILQQLIKNSERLVVVEKDITQMKTSITKVNNDITQINQELSRSKSKRNYSENRGSNRLAEVDWGRSSCALIVCNC